MVLAGGLGPLLVAHRVGITDYSENILLAIRKALDNSADTPRLSVQLSTDGRLVLYRPADLAVLTQGAGVVGQSSLAELARLSTGCMFKAEDGSYPYYQKPLRISTLYQALRAIPSQVPVFPDMKPLPVEPLVDAVAGELEWQKAQSRVRFYSTEKVVNDHLTQRCAGRARQFGNRNATRNRLIGLAFGERCEALLAGGTWMGIELRCELMVTERFTLGESSHKVSAAQPWTRKAMNCVCREPVKVVMFGIGIIEDYRTTRVLGVDAVTSNSPRKMEAIRRRMPADQSGG